MLHDGHIYGAAGEGGLDTNNPSMPVVIIPFIGMELDSAIRIADKFSDLFAVDFAFNIG